MRFWIMSNHAAVVGKPAIQSTPIIQPQRVGTREGQRVDETPRAAVRCLGVLTSLTSAYIFGHVDVLADPERKALHERPGLGFPKVATERSVMALQEHLLA